jgi:preprotein translocase subunit SecG
MKSESIFTLVMTVLAIVLGILNNNQKAKKREQQARRKYMMNRTGKNLTVKPEFQLSVAPETGRLRIQKAKGSD